MFGHFSVTGLAGIAWSGVVDGDHSELVLATFFQAGRWEVRRSSWHFACFHP